MTRYLAPARRLLPAAAVLLLAGCLGTPKDNLYTLNPVIQPSGETRAPGYTIEVAAVTIPDLVDRPQIVVRDSDNKVSMLEQQRWAASLSSQLPQVIAEDIGRLLPDARVKPTGEAAAGEVTYRLAVDIQRFDSVLGKAAILDAQWSARRLADGNLQVGRFTVSEPAGPGYEALAAAHGRALGGLSQQIADAIAADHAQAPPPPSPAATPALPKKPR